MPFFFFIHVGLEFCMDYPGEYVVIGNSGLEFRRKVKNWRQRFGS